VDEHYRDIDVVERIMRSPPTLFIFAQVDNGRKKLRGPNTGHGQAFRLGHRDIRGHRFRLAHRYMEPRYGRQIITQRRIPQRRRSAMRRRMNKAHRDRAVEPSPLSYMPTPGANAITSVNPNPPPNGHWSTWPMAKPSHKITHFLVYLARSALQEIGPRMDWCLSSSATAP
jgi:hypothetical protein